MYQKLLKLLCLLAINASCNSDMPEGFRKISPGVFYCLHAFGDNDNKPGKSDIITIDFSYSTLNDSVFYQSRRRIRLDEDKFPGSVKNSLMNFHIGDSVTMILKAKDLFEENLHTPVPHFLSPDEKIKLNFKLSEIQSSNEFFAELISFMHWFDGDIKEGMNFIRIFLEAGRYKFPKSSDEIFFVLLKNGDGKKPEKGDLVRINFEGRFINGQYFDSTLKQGEPLEFIFGDDLMVIKGLELALGQMREGDKALVIVPHRLAFGAMGAGDGIVPANTPVIYELELLLAQNLN